MTVSPSSIHPVTTWGRQPAAQLPDDVPSVSGVTSDSCRQSVRDLALTHYRLPAWVMDGHNCDTEAMPIGGSFGMCRYDEEVAR